jgi:dihydroceramidase
LVIAARAISETKKNQLSPLCSRAISNSQIRRAFGIENAFTSSDVKYAKHFVTVAKSLINLKPTNWERLSVVTLDALRSRLIDSASSGSSDIHLTSLVQTLSLKATLLTLFEFDDSRLCQTSENHIVSLARAINQTWISSKQGEVSRFDKNDHLQTSIRAIFVGQDLRAPEENPLNLIIPGFETLWRVVLRGFLEIGFIAGKQHPEWCAMLAAFAQAPTKEQFLQEHGAHSISCEDLVNEVLRLYPPTRRIRRTFQWDMAGEPVTMAADLEACHRLRDIWGTNAMDYDPRRWRRLTKGQKQAFMPFGSAPFECPARPVFGPRIIGLLLGTLFREIRRDSTFKLHGRRFLDSSSPMKRLSNERSALGEVYLCHKMRS